MTNASDKKPKVEYRRLPGKKKAFFRKNTLWMGDDHVLAVESCYFSERYNRLYFKDFQAITIRQTNSFKTRNVVISALAGLSVPALVASAAGDHRVLVVFSGMVLLTLLVALVMNLARGATCTCRVKMPLAVHNLPSVCRLKYAERILAEIIPSVQKFQGSLGTDEIRFKAMRGEVSGSYSPPKLRMIVSPPAVLEEGSCFVHMLTSGVLLFNAFAATGEFYFDNFAVNALNVLTGGALFALVITALVRQHRRVLPRSLKGWTWTTAALLVVFTCVEFTAAWMIIVFKKGPQARLGPLYTLGDLSPAANPVMAKITICYVVICAVLALWGLGAIMVHRSSARREKIHTVADNSGAAGGEAEKA